MPEGDVNMGVVDRDVKALAERAGGSQRAKMREPEKLLAIRYQPEKEIEGGFRYSFRTIDQISAGWGEFYQIEGRIEENELIICEYSQLLLELSSFSSRQEEQMRSQRSQIQERGAGVARSESQLVLPLLATGSESTTQQQPQQQLQQQFKTEVVVACRDEVELETTGEEQEELLQLPLKQQQLQHPAAPPPVWTSQLVSPLLETGSESTAQQQPQGQQEHFETGEKGWLEDLVVKLNYEQDLSCSVRAPAAEPVDVWARVGVGTLWLVAMEDAGCGRHGHPGVESIAMSREQLFLSRLLS